MRAGLGFAALRSAATVAFIALFAARGDVAGVLAGAQCLGAWMLWVPQCLFRALWPGADDIAARARSAWPIALVLALAAPPLFALAPAGLATLPLLPLLQLPGRALPPLSGLAHGMGCTAVLLLRIQVLRFCTELAIVCCANAVPAARVFLAKPLSPPKLAACAACLLSGHWPPPWGEIPECGVQLRPLACLFGHAVLVLRGLHVDTSNPAVMQLVAATPITLEWTQIGVLSVYVPSPVALAFTVLRNGGCGLSPGVHVRVDDIYVRARTYDFSTAEETEARLRMAWEKATADKLAALKSAYAMYQAASSGGDTAAGSASPAAPAGDGGGIAAKVASAVADNTGMVIKNIEVVLCGGPHPDLAPSLASVAAGASTASQCEQSEFKLHLRRLEWTQAPSSTKRTPEQPVDTGAGSQRISLLPTEHRFCMVVDTRLEGRLMACMSIAVSVKIDAALDGPGGSFLLRSVTVSVPAPVPVSVDQGPALSDQAEALQIQCKFWLREVAALPRFVGWLNHAQRALLYAPQKCNGGRLMLRPLHAATPPGNLGDGVLVLQTRHRKTADASEEGGELMAAASVASEENDLARAKTWAELDDTARDCCERLGCGSAAGWDNGRSVVWLKSWAELTPNEQSAATMLGFDEWLWDEQGDEPDYAAREAGFFVAMANAADREARDVLLHGMHAQLRQINARRCWEYAGRCVRQMTAEHSPARLFMHQVKKKRAHEQYIELWQQQQKVETETNTTQTTPANPGSSSSVDANNVDKQLAELERASLPHQSTRWMPVRVPLMTMPEILHARMVAEHCGDEDAREHSAPVFDPSPPTAAPVVAGPKPTVRASLAQVDLYVLPRASDKDSKGSLRVQLTDITAKSEPALVDPVVLATSDTAPGEQTGIVLTMKMGRIGISTDNSFEFVYSEGELLNLCMKDGANDLETVLSGTVGKLNIISDFRPIGFLLAEMAKGKKDAALTQREMDTHYTDLVPHRAAASESEHFHDAVSERWHAMWSCKFDEICEGSYDSSAGPELACEVVTYVMNEYRDGENEDLAQLKADKSVAAIDWPAARAYAERVRYRFDFQRLQNCVEFMCDGPAFTIEEWLLLLDDVEMERNMQDTTATHARMRWDIAVASPQIVLRGNPEGVTGQDGCQLVIRPGNIAITSLYRVELVLCAVHNGGALTDKSIPATSSVGGDGADTILASFVQEFKANVAASLGIPDEDLCHVDVDDVTVPAPSGRDCAKMRHVLRSRRLEFAEKLQHFQRMEQEFHEGSEKNTTGTFYGTLSATSIRHAVHSLGLEAESHEIEEYADLVIDSLGRCSSAEDSDVLLSCMGKMDPGALVSTRATEECRDLLVSFSIRPRRGTKPSEYQAVLDDQASDENSALKSGSLTRSIEPFGINVWDPLEKRSAQHTYGETAYHRYYDQMHAIWSGFEVVLERATGVKRCSTLVNNFQLHCSVGTCFLPQMHLTPSKITKTKNSDQTQTSPVLTRTRIRLELSPLQAQASMQDANDISVLAAALGKSLHRSMAAGQTEPPGSTAEAAGPGPVPPQSQVAVQQVGRELQVDMVCGVWKLQLQHAATGRPLLELSSQLRLPRYTSILKENGELVVAGLDFAMQAQYDNSHVGYWEPLIEPWTLSIDLRQNPRRTTAKLYSPQMLNVCVSHSLLQNVIGNLAANSTDPATVDEKQQVLMATPSSILNLTGADLCCRLGFRPNSAAISQASGTHYHHPAFTLAADSSFPLEGEAELSSAYCAGAVATAKALAKASLPARELRVEFPNGKWKPLILSNLNRAGVSRVLLHRDHIGEGAGASDIAHAPTASKIRNVKQHFPRRQPNAHDKALVITAARMATRSTIVYVDNQSPFTLVRVDTEPETPAQTGTRCVKGEWAFHSEPPLTIAPNEMVLFASESHDLMNGTEAMACYRYAYAAGAEEEKTHAEMRAHWHNPLFGQPTAVSEHGSSASGNAEAPPGVEVDIEGPSVGHSNEVTYVVRKSSIDASTNFSGQSTDQTDQEQETVVCAVDITDDGRKVIMLCTPLRFENSTQVDVQLQLGNATNDWSAQLLTVRAGASTYVPIEMCTFTIARVRPLQSGAEEWHWSEQVLQLGASQFGSKGDEDPGNGHGSELCPISCRGPDHVFHCAAAPEIAGHLDVRVCWRLQPAVRLLNMLPCSLSAVLHADKGSSETLSADAADARGVQLGEIVLVPGQRAPLATKWPVLSAGQYGDDLNQKQIWLRALSFGSHRNEDNNNSESDGRVLIYAESPTETGGNQKGLETLATSFALQLDGVQLGRVSISYDDPKLTPQGASYPGAAGIEVVLYVSHWVINRTPLSLQCVGYGTQTGARTEYGNTGRCKIIPIAELEDELQPESEEESDCERRDYEMLRTFNMLGISGGDGTGAREAKMGLSFDCQPAPKDTEALCSVDIVGSVEKLVLTLPSETNDEKSHNAPKTCAVMARVRLAEGEFGRCTKVVELNPMWVLVNASSHDFTIREPPAESDSTAKSALVLTKSLRVAAAARTAAADKPFTLFRGGSREVFSAPRVVSRERVPLIALKLAIGVEVPVVEESIIVRVWEHERRVFTQGWGAEFLGESPLRTPIAGDPKHLMLQTDDTDDGSQVPLNIVGRSSAKGAGAISALLHRTIQKQGDEWQWVDTWDVEKDSDHGNTDSKGWMYAEGLKIIGPNLAPGGWAKLEWDAEFNSDHYFRRRCWVRTQRRYLTTAARKAAKLGSEIKSANTPKLQELCKDNGLWDRIPAERRGRPRFLRNQLNSMVNRQTRDVWSPLAPLPATGGNVQLALPAPSQRRGRGGDKLGASRQIGGDISISININVSTTPNGTQLVVLSDARQPNFSVDNRSSIPLQYRLVTTFGRRTKMGPWVDVPPEPSRRCVDIWEGDTGSALQLRLKNADEEGPIVPMDRVGACSPWHLQHMTATGPASITLLPSIIIQREAKTLRVGRLATKQESQNSNTTLAAAMSAVFEVDISLAGLGLSVVDKRPKELMYLAVRDISLKQNPIGVVKVQICRIHGLAETTEDGTASRVRPIIRLGLGGQTYATAPAESEGASASWDGEVAQFNQLQRSEQLRLEVWDAGMSSPNPAESTASDQESAAVETLVGTALIDVSTLQQSGPFEGWFDVRSATSSGSSGGSAPLATRVFLKLAPTASGSNLQLLEFGVRSFTIDNQNATAITPVVIGPRPKHASQEHLLIICSMSTSPDGLTLMVNDFTLEMAPTHVMIEWPFLQGLIDFAGALPARSTAHNSHAGVLELQRQALAVRGFKELEVIATQLASAPGKIYVDRVHIGTIELTATTRLKELVATVGSGSRGGPPLLKALMRTLGTVGVAVIEVTDAPISISSLTLPDTKRGEEAFMTQQELTNTVTAHVVREGAMCAFKILGAVGPLNLIGQYEGLVSGLGSLKSGALGLVTDGDVVGMGEGVLGLGKSLVHAQVKTLSGAVGLLGSVADQSKLLRPVGMLLGGVGDLLDSAAEAIDGVQYSKRVRDPRQFGHEGQMHIYSPAITFGRQVLNKLASSRQIPYSVAEQECIGSCHTIGQQGITTIATATHILQVHTATGKLVEGAATSLLLVTSCYLQGDGGGLAITRTHALNYVIDKTRPKAARVPKETFAHVEGMDGATLQLDACSAAEAEEFLESLITQLKLHAATRANSYQQEQGIVKWTELHSPVLTVTVAAAEGLPSGRHAQAVGFELIVPGAATDTGNVDTAHYQSRKTSPDEVSPLWQETCSFVIPDYATFLDGALELRVWDRNTVETDDIIGSTGAELGAWLPTFAQLYESSSSNGGDCWFTGSGGGNHVDRFELVGKRRRRGIKRVVDLADSSEHMLPVGWAMVSMKLSLQRRWCWIADAYKQPPKEEHKWRLLATTTKAAARLHLPVHRHHHESVASSIVSAADSQCTAFMVHVRVLSGWALPLPSGSLDSDIDAYVTLSYLDEPTQKSTVIRGINPCWMEVEEEQHRFAVASGSAERFSRIRGEVWDRAMVPPDTRLATFEIHVAETQLEVVVRDVELTPCDGTEPQTEKSTLRLMCVRTMAALRQPAKTPPVPAGPPGATPGTDNEISNAPTELSREEQAAMSRASKSVALLISGIQHAMLETDTKKHELAATSAARAVADLCYQTDADAPLRRASFGQAGGVVALVALMHASPPTSPVGVNVADALRLLALDDEPTVALAVEARGGIELLEDIVQQAPTPTGAVAQCVAVLKGQLKRAAETTATLEAQNIALDSNGAATSNSSSGRLSVWSQAPVKSELLEDGEVGKLIFKFEVRATGADGKINYSHTLRTRFSVGLLASPLCLHTLCGERILPSAAASRHKLLTEAVDIERWFNPPLKFPSKYGLRDMNTPDNIALRQSELLLYYRRVADFPHLLKSSQAMAVLGIETGEQRAALQKGLE